MTNIILAIGVIVTLFVAVAGYAISTREDESKLHSWKKEYED